MPRNVEQSVKNSDRALKALELRKRGYGYQEIAHKLGYANSGGSFKAVDRALKQIKTEGVEELRRVECERLDLMLKALEKKIKSGDPKAIAVAARLSESRRRLLGLDAPEKLDIEGSVDLYTLTKAAAKRRAERERGNGDNEPT